YFGTVIPPNDNKFAALNSAVWSGGSFVYVPAGVRVEIPLQAYFRINTESMGQFERTLIIAEEGSFVHYIEGCTAPTYSKDSLHSAVVEIIAMPNAHVRYTTIQNWSNNVYNLVTKRAIAKEHSVVEWIDGNLGSKVTMKYPSIYLMGEGAHGEVLSVAFAGDGQHQDAGAKVIHVAPNTTSTIVSKSVSKGTGRTSYRGHLKVYPKAHNVRSSVRCDALLLDEQARSDTYPYMDVEAEDVQIGHEATVSKVGDEQLFYLQSRGITEAEATAMIVNGFIEPFVKELPMEYALELNRLISLQMEGSVG
ncbi:MAG: Fe-S cluster assembly protein SufB, partial [Candidatus Dormiibacterota bacterium]